MNFKKRALSLLMALTFIFGTVGNLAVYAVDDVHTHEHTTLDDTSDTTDTSDESTTHTCKFDIKGETIPPTCAEDGYTIYKCSCGKTEKRDPVKATDKHICAEDKWYTIDDGDCLNPGKQQGTCEVCGKKITRPITGDHKWSETTTPPNCEKEGEEKRTCSVCGKTEKTPIPATGHDWDNNWVEIKAPTCREKGKEQCKCKNCNTTRERDTIPQPNNHTWKNATCTTPKTCSSCGVTEGKPLGHNFDANHDGKVTTDDGVITIDSTCTKLGTRKYTCTTCGYEHSLDNVPAKGHDLGAWVTTKEPTCDKAGEKKQTCSRCELSKTETIPALGHKSSDWKIKEEATCTKAGIKHKVCLVCGKELESINYELNPKGHTWSAWQTTKEPTYDTAGEETRTCTRCGAKEINRLPTIAKDHTHSFNGKQSVIKKASCTESGKNRVYCSHKGCNEYKEITTEPLGHAFGDYEVTQEADCINTGVRRCECSRCGATQSETTPPHGHQYSEWLVTRESSDTESGIRQRTCDICGDIQIETFLGTPEEVDVNATLPNGTHGVTLTVPNGQTMTDEERKAKNRKKAVGVTVITVAFAAVTAGAALLITKKKKK